MNSKKTLFAAAALSAVVVAPLANAGTNPFSTTELAAGFNMNEHAGEGKCGEGKCGEGKCGEGVDDGKKTGDEPDDGKKAGDDEPKDEKPAY